MVGRTFRRGRPEADARALPGGHGRRPRHAAAVALLFGLVTAANTALDGGDLGVGGGAVGAAFRRSPARWASTSGGRRRGSRPTIADVARRRDAARAAKDWAPADALRDELSLGWDGRGHARKAQRPPGLTQGLSRPTGVQVRE